MTTVQLRKKLIEVALPLDEINAACKADKDRKTGTLRNLHKWFAPMPLPAWRALLFAALIDDPADDERRAYLLDVIKRLVANGADRPDAQVMEEAKTIIAGQYPDGVPGVLDPFCGGGSTLVEAQRLGLPGRGSDLNPVPALITRTLTSLLPSVYGQQPLHPRAEAVGLRPGRRVKSRDQETLTLIPSPTEAVAFSGYGGLIRDVTHYAEQIRAAAWAVLGDFYATRAGETPVAWLWARTATCPNPACGIRTPLTTSWWVSKKKNDLAWIEPSVVKGQVRLDVISGQRGGAAPEAPKVGRGASFTCLNCGSVLGEDVLIRQGKAGELGLQMTCVVAEVDGRRTYRAPSEADIEAASSVELDDDFPNIPLPDIPRWFSGPRFGIRTQAALYTPRQLVTHTTLADLIAETHAQVVNDGGTEQWATAVTTLLALSLGKMVQVASTLAIWRHEPTAKAEAALSSHSMPMMWDFPEVYPFGESVGNWMGQVKTACRAFALLPEGETSPAEVVKGDARTSALARPGLVATDPPYFDTIGYADISDYFYVWHRRALRSVHPDLYATIAAPKSGELTAVPAHHGNSKTAARQYFIDGFTETFQNLKSSMAADLPMLVVYASKEQKGGQEEETRWSSILTAITRADLEITGTWPVRGTTAARMISAGTNAVASYVVMVCRPRPVTAGSCSLNDFNRFLRRELKPAVHAFQAAGILPVDLAQAAMGPGMQVYSRYREVVDQSGKRVPVEQALRLISAALGEVLDEQEGELDSYSRFAVAWWERHHWSPAAFGEADQMARPQGITVDAVVRAGVVTYPKPGFVSVLGLTDMDRQWRPASDRTPTAWEAVHHLADRLIDGGGTAEAGRLMGELGSFRDPAQSLVYRLHDVAAKKNRLKDQERYNALIGSWSDLIAISATERDGLF